MPAPMSRNGCAPSESPSRLGSGPAGRRVVKQPVGVVGVLAPWNYPLYLAAAPLASALAAGNRVIIKPSEFTPQFSELLARLIARYFARDHVAVVNGGVEVARAFAARPFDHLLFSGSTAVGREVMRAAAENLTPVTLELGGKSPAIVAPASRSKRRRSAFLPASASTPARRASPRITR